MKFITFRPVADPSTSRLGVVVSAEAAIDLTAASAGSPPFLSLQALIEAGPAALATARRIATMKNPEFIIPMDRLKLEAPLPLPVQFRDSMSFHKHIIQAATTGARRRAEETGDPARIAAAEEFVSTYRLPEIYRRQPTYYKGNRFNVAGPDETVTWPKYSRLMDFELELACVIGRGGKDIPKQTAHDHIFGYMIFNDLSARDAQALEMEGRLGPAKGKDFDKGNVFGPCLVTADEIGDPYALRMQARVNGETWCDSNSSTMHWRFDDLIEHISRDETLYPGEIIGSGTVGDGCGLEHGRFLRSGDVIELEIEKIGVLKTTVVRAEDQDQEAA